MDIEKNIGVEELLGQMPPGQYLLGFLSEFNNRYQACADSFFKEITWKQFFAIICIRICGNGPTINELSEVMGSSHQNVKQILNKLESKGFVEVFADENDRRKQRIRLTDKCERFCEEHNEQSQKIIGRLFMGIPDEKLVETIKTIGMVEENMKNIMKEI